MRTLWVLVLGVVQVTFGTGGGLGQFADSNTLQAPIDALKLQIDLTKPGYLNNTEFPGTTFDSPDLDSPDPALCAALCAKDEHCRGWTFRKPRPGVRYRCDLKGETREAVANSCCISGRKVVVAPGVPEKICEIDTTKMSGNSPHCMGYIEADVGRENEQRVIHIVNSSWWHEMNWRKPSHWRDGSFNECRVVFEREKESCDRMKGSK